MSIASLSPFQALPALQTESVNLPFLGSRVTPHATFQYLLQDVSARGVTFAVPRELRKLPGYTQLPVIMLTTRGQSDIRELAEELG